MYRIFVKLNFQISVQKFMVISLSGEDSWRKSHEQLGISDKG